MTCDAPADVERADASLDVRDLTVRFQTRDGVVQAVSDLSFTLRRGETLGVVGESGSGKSVTSLAIMGLLNRGVRRHQRRDPVRGHATCSALKGDELRKIRGRDISMIFQDPFACLHPMYRVGDQIAEAVQRARERLEEAGVRAAPSSCSARSASRTRACRARDYPHQFSGGMRQRAMIAMALVHNPDVLIADEPTTALDVTVQAQIIELIDRVKKEFDIGVILITHDLGVVAETATHVMVMYAGRAMEYGAGARDLQRARSTRTRGACSSRCRRSTEAARRAWSPIEGSPPSLLNPPPGCRVPPALQVPLRAVRQGAAAARADPRRPSRRLPPARRAQARDLDAAAIARRARRRA